MWVRGQRQGRTNCKLLQYLPALRPSVPAGEDRTVAEIAIHTGFGEAVVGHQGFDQRAFLSLASQCSDLLRAPSLSHFMRAIHLTALDISDFLQTRRVGRLIDVSATTATASPNQFDLLERQNGKV